MYLYSEDHFVVQLKRSLPIEVVASWKIVDKLQLEKGFIKNYMRSGEVVEYQNKSRNFLVSEWGDLMIMKHD